MTFGGKNGIKQPMTLVHWKINAWKMMWWIVDGCDIHILVDFEPNWLKVWFRRFSGFQFLVIFGVDVLPSSKLT